MSPSGWMNRRKREQERKKRQLLLETLGLADEGTQVFVEGLDSYEAEYKKTCANARREHRSILRVIECDDHAFYDLSSQQRLQRFGLDAFRQVLFDTTDDIDFTADDSMSEAGMLNEKRVRVSGTSVTGCTTIVEKDGVRRSVVFMRNATGSERSDDVRFGTKLGALLHEFGHVDDFEKQIHWKHATLNLVDAEVYAHHYACRTMVERHYLILLDYYLTGVQQMAESKSEYIRRAAARVLESPECREYRAVVEAYHRKMGIKK